MVVFTLNFVPFGTQKIVQSPNGINISDCNCFLSDFIHQRFDFAIVSFLQSFIRDCLFGFRPINFTHQSLPKLIFI